VTEGAAARLPAAVVGIGASAGGVEALSTLIGQLPADIDAAILVVLHVSARGPSVLPDILSRSGALDAAHAVDGEPLERGRVYVAPPDRHLVLRGAHVRVLDGPKENGVRPGIDVLFRSLAQSFGARAVAVVLSGMLDDGTAGARAIKQAGGKVLVQDPREAVFPAMPASAAAFADPDRVAGLKELAGAVAAIVADRSASGRGPTTAKDVDPTEEPSEFTCPDCGGTLFFDPAVDLPHFRCRVGHAYSPESLLVGKEVALEAALWAAIVALEERADLSRRMVRRLGQAGVSRSTERYLEQTEEAERQARTIRQLLTRIKVAHLEGERGSTP
jgi:two-component system chemotaxis response regulator CheB